jgi:pimeloyl-ACP methyl ester carboxylesterase
MFPTAAPTEVRRAVREFLTTPVDWYGRLAVAAATHRRVSLSKIAVPTSFVAGRWDVLTSHVDMRTAAERVEDATYVELFGTHFLTLERPEEIVRLLHELVERIEEVGGPGATAGSGKSPGRTRGARAKRGRAGSA